MAGLCCDLSWLFSHTRLQTKPPPRWLQDVQDGQRAGEGGEQGKLGAGCNTPQALLPSGSVHVSLCGLFPPAPPQPLWCWGRADLGSVQGLVTGDQSLKSPG